VKRVRSLWVVCNKNGPERRMLWNTVHAYPSKSEAKRVAATLSDAPGSGNLVVVEYRIVEDKP
jgi:hypothetical protein